MTNRWSILAVLFLARLTMAFQFQAVAALSPWITESYRIGLAEIGLLIGLYLAPGVLVAIPGGAVAAWLGEKRVVAAGMVAMLAGGALVILSPGYEAFVAGRLIAGAGGVIINIVMTKMLVDWFEGREISTALAIFVNSWPVGIALALLTLPVLAGAGDLALARWGVVAVIALALLLFLLLYQPPPGITAPGVALRPAALPYLPLICAGLVWALYNSALAMVFSFGAEALRGRGWSLTEANGAISGFMIVFSLALPLGGYLADRTGRRDAIIAVSLAGAIVCLPLLPILPGWLVAATLVVTAVLFALAAGPIMTLPAAVLRPEARTLGMGVYFAIYYVVMMIAPRLAGGAADAAGSAGIALTLGAVQAAGALVCLTLYRRSARPPDPSA